MLQCFRFETFEFLLNPHLVEKKEKKYMRARRCLSILCVPVLICMAVGAAAEFPGQSLDHCYASIDSLWADLDDRNLNFYGSIQDYYSHVSSDDSALTGVDVSLQEVDILETEMFLKPVIGKMKDPRRALDVAAGNGRISDLFLSRYFHKIDVIEASPHLLRELQSRMERHGSTLDNVLQVSVLDVVLPLGQQYDVIVLNWIGSHLKDDDLVALLTKCRKALSRRGAVFFKDNITPEFFWHSVNPLGIQRSIEHFEAIFAKAGLRARLDQKQTRWPAYLMQMHMFLLMKSY